MSSYLELLHLSREPFSNSPDPDAYCRTSTHEDCLNRLEIAIRLRRGLNVVLGEVGTGKSTLCRYLLRSLSSQPDMEVFLLLDPGFEDADGLVAHLYGLFTGQTPPENVPRRELISRIQTEVFDRALEAGHNMVLFVDEGQKMSPSALEVLRELLNFETNTEKLLQIVIFGQPELERTIDGMPNFKDRINESLYLRPLEQSESVALVRYRLRLAGGQAAEQLFSDAALKALHAASHGRPRQLMRLGHQMLIGLLVSDRRVVTRSMVLVQAARNDGTQPAARSTLRWWLWPLLVFVLLGALAAIPQTRDWMRHTILDGIGSTGVNGPVAAGAGTPSEASSSAGAAGNAGLSSGTPASSAGARPDVPAAPIVQPEKAQERSGKAPAGQMPVAAASSEGPAPGSGAVATQQAPAAPSGSAAEQPADRQPEGGSPLLGVLTLGDEDPEGILAALYGPDKDLAGKITALNPVYMPGVPLPGQQLRLPVIACLPPHKLTGGQLLSIGSYDVPEKAYAVFKGYKARSIPVELVPLREGNGYRFHILSTRPFWSASQAWTWVSRYSPDAGAEIRLLPAFQPKEPLSHCFSVK